MSRRQLTQARQQHALAMLLAAWMPPDDAEEIDNHKQRRRYFRLQWPQLCAALDELVLATTADTAAQIEEMQAALAPREIDALVDTLPAVICPGSGAPVLSRKVHLPARGTTPQAECSQCHRQVKVRQDSKSRLWHFASHRKLAPQPA